MNLQIKQRLLAAVGILGFQIRATRPKWPHFPKFSLFGEEEFIARHFEKFPPRNRFFADIGASDGVTISNTCRLALEGWSGLAVEPDPKKFAFLAEHYANFPRVSLSRSFATPETIHALLRVADAPRDLDFLSLDIDSLDFWVLETLLQSFLPRLICVEINETIPPPLSFTLRRDANLDHAGQAQFFGMSLSQVTSLARMHGYGLLHLEYNNAFFASRDETGIDLEDATAFREGYLEKPERRENFPWNQAWEPIFSLSPSDAANFVRQQFANFATEYDLTWPE